MSNQPPSNNKNWLYFAFGSGTMLLLGSIAFILLNLNKSAQSQIAGTWTVDANDLPSSRTPQVTIVISSEGKIIAIDPQHEKEAIKVGKITRVSDVVTLPNDVKLKDISSQGERARQSEAKTYVGSLNRAQQAYFIEKNKWGQNIDVLGIGIKSETDNYRYNTQTINSIKTTNTKDSSGITVQTGLATKEGLKSYIGVVYLLTVAGGDISTFAILCESTEPTTKEAGLPKFDGKEMQCPDGYANISK
ncbi:type IV pilin PilA [Pseudanabaena sp. lw0831]|uniref:type IV pilin-like G/H family protein n=1 Tax=Pseudanabaena sp. lw0831 TaxID=1357935 RepID=UPI0019156BBF|nr:type IV pilin-like G/H family protein [Pseudanabaena sp. lw0831]GBO53656.1 type IV pilin PilA [Pseudanabaena sp. lw0831]